MFVINILFLLPFVSGSYVLLQSFQNVSPTQWNAMLYIGHINIFYQPVVWYSSQAIENKEVLAIEYKKTTEVQEERPPSPSPPPPPPPPPSEPVKVEAPPVQPPPDLLVIIFFFCVRTCPVFDIIQIAYWLFE